jgi:dTDP-4-amino-4,6-dideoxygalactose transaminase
MVNLRSMLEAVGPVWRANLRRLFAGSQFILGEQVAEFERELAIAFGAKYAVTVGSGTSALELCLRAAGLGESGAEVVVPALTSPFTAQAVLAAGCRPRFADVDAQHLLLDAESAIARVGDRTRALLPVHLYGQPCDVSWAPRSLILAQDACQAHGAGPFTKASPYVAYSFYPTKNLPCLGDGGAVVTNVRRVADSIRLLRDGGRRSDQLSRVRAVNSRLDEMQACYLRAFLPKLAEWNTQRTKLCAWYDELLADCEGFRPLRRREGSVCHLYVGRAVRRDPLRKFLAARGIASGVHYPVPLHLHPAFQGYGAKRGHLPVAEQACRRIVPLPLWPGMRRGMVEEVAGRVREFYVARPPWAARLKTQ